MLIIGIAGASGSGKSTFARYIHNAYPDRSSILSLDEFYFDFKISDNQSKRDINFDHPNCIDFNLLQTVILDLKEQGQAEIPKYSFASSSRTGSHLFNAPEILILEGHLLFTNPAIVELIDLKYFIEASLDICLIRRIHRDMHERQRSLDSILKQYLDHVRDMYLEFIEPSSKVADIILVDGESDFQPESLWPIQQLLGR